MLTLRVASRNNRARSLPADALAQAGHAWSCHGACQDQARAEQGGFPIVSVGDWLAKGLTLLLGAGAALSSAMPRAGLAGAGSQAGGRSKAAQRGKEALPGEG